MSELPQLADILKDVRTASENFCKAEKLNNEALTELKESGKLLDTKVGQVVDGQKAFDTKLQGFESSLNELYKKISRPGFETRGSDEEVENRKSALTLLETKHEWKVSKKDPEHPFAPTEDQVKEAIIYNRAFPAMLNSCDVSILSPEYRKALTAFNFGSSGFLLEPAMNARVLSCLVDPTDVAGLFQNMAISQPSVKFMIDQTRATDVAAWACESTCFANNPQPQLEGLGELEIKPETLRYIVCATRDLIEDASINVENWMMEKVSKAFRATISAALIAGDGIGKPPGILNPNSGIPICDSGANTPAGQFSWQDLIALKWQVPMQFQGGTQVMGGGSYFMNQNTFALILTMSDSNGRPLLSALPQGTVPFVLNGSPVQIVTQMPEVAPGTTPVAFGNWREVYMVVNRKAVTMQQDPYSAGFCILYKFEARVGGGIICPNAARLLRIK